MTEIAGGIGAGTVIVFQPATPSGGLEVALGIQRFWQKTLKQAGRPAACLIANTRVERIEGTPPIEMPIAVGDKGVAAIGDWADEAATAALVVARGGRWGLVATLTAAGIRGGIETKLFEAKPGSGAANIATWSFSGAASAVPEHVALVLTETARRVGVQVPWSSHVDAFGTADPGAAMLVLELMGVVSMAEDDCRLLVGAALQRLGLLVQAAPTSRVVVAIVPELLGHLGRLGAHDLQLGAWMREVKRQLGALPPEWEGLVASISRARR